MDEQLTLVTLACADCGERLAFPQDRCAEAVADHATGCRPQCDNAFALSALRDLYVVAERTIFAGKSVPSVDLYGAFEEAKRVLDACKVPAVRAVDRRYEVTPLTGAMLAGERGKGHPGVYERDGRLLALFERVEHAEVFARAMNGEGALRLCVEALRAHGRLAEALEDAGDDEELRQCHVQTLREMTWEALAAAESLAEVGRRSE